MAKIIITNLDTLIDVKVTENVNVIAANAASVNTTAKAEEAAISAGVAESHKIAAGVNAGIATTKANNASVSAGVSTTQAGIATTQAGLATTAKNNTDLLYAASLDVLAQTNKIYDDFDDRYLRGHSSDPIVNNDGDAIIDGALYWNTTSKEIKVYSQTSNAWIALKDIGSGALLTANNLADVANTVTARTNLDVYSKVETTTEMGTAVNTHLLDTSVHGVTTVVGAVEVQTLTHKTMDDVSNWIGANHIHYNVKALENLPAGAIVMGMGYNSGEDVFEVSKWTLASGKPALGMNHHALLTGEIGFIAQSGQIKDIDTSALTIGVVYYPADGGLLTATKPTTGSYQEAVYVLRSHSSQGAVTVNFASPVAIASTTLPGYVQLNDTLTSTSTVQALTAARGKELQDSKVAANTAITAGTGTKVTYDTKGLVTSSTTLSAIDIPVLDMSKLTTGTLPVLRGGTGVTTSTGTGNVVLSSSPTLVTPVLGVATGTSFNSITGLASVVSPMDGVAAVGVSTASARQDHVHASDTTKVDKSVIVTSAITSVTFNVDGSITIVTP